ncbi:MAG: site-specific integrase [Flavobacteriales bacterium]|nr:site-specific integrase [Flavobacteriales bacterium]
MSSIKLVLRKDKIRSNGEAPLFIRITKDRKSRYKALNVTFEPRHWDDKRDVVKQSYPNSVRMNNFLRQKLTEAATALLELDSSEKQYRSKDVFEKIEGKKIGFLEYSTRFLERRESINSPGMIKRMKTVIRKIQDYLEGKDIFLSSIDVSWLYDYETHLRKKLGNTTNTVGANMSGIRAIFNEAIREGAMPVGTNPFDIYKIRREQTEIEFLSEEELESFVNVPLKTDSRIEQHRNLYVFACYAAGIRIGDLLTLKWKNFDGERLSFVMRKTGDKLSIKLGRTALEIVNKQKGSDNRENFLFGLLPKELSLENRKAVDSRMSSVNALINKNLKIIASRAGIQKNIHFHTSRHTWATRAINKNMPIVSVSKLLGHRSIKTTMIYVKVLGLDLEAAMDEFFMD